jgi:hypothetical protein
MNIPFQPRSTGTDPPHPRSGGEGARRTSFGNSNPLICSRQAWSPSLSVCKGSMFFCKHRRGVSFVSFGKNPDTSSNTRRARCAAKMCAMPDWFAAQGSSPPAGWPAGVSPMRFAHMPCSVARMDSVVLTSSASLSSGHALLLTSLSCIAVTP